MPPPKGHSRRAARPTAAANGAAAPARVACVLFDLDNTLIDTDPLMREALDHCGCEGADTLSCGDLRTLSPNQLLRRLNSQLDAAQFWSHYRRLVGGRAELLDPETPRVLRALRDRGVQLGLVTSSVKPPTIAALRRCGILAYFEPCLVTYSRQLRPKPHPDPIRRALELLGTAAEAAMYVGDAVRDACASHGAGVRFALAGWAPGVDPATFAALGPTTVLRSAADLLRHT